MSRYAPSDFSTDKKGRFMRCIECDGEGHFKCSTENQSIKVKLNFTVQNDIDEFLKKSSRLRLRTPGSSLSSSPEPVDKKSKKRDKKLKHKKKKKKVRRLSNSNIVIPTSDSDNCEPSSPSVSSHSSDSSLSDSGNPFKNHAFMRRLKAKKLRKLEQSSSMLQCTSCAGYHDISLCPVQRLKKGGSQNYSEAARSKYASSQAPQFNFKGSY